MTMQASRLVPCFTKDLDREYVLAPCPQETSFYEKSNPKRVIINFSINS